MLVRLPPLVTVRMMMVSGFVNKDIVIIKKGEIGEFDVNNCVLPSFFIISMFPWMMNPLSKLKGLFPLVSVLLHLLVTGRTWLVGGSVSKICHHLFPTSVHHLLHHNGTLPLLCWLKSSQSFAIFKHLWVSFLMPWILKSLNLKMIWVSSGVASIPQPTLTFVSYVLCA